MRTTTGGDGSDTTAATQAYLAATDRPIIRDLIIIGPPENPNALYLTDHEAPVLYRPYGLFQPAVLTRDRLKCQIGLSAQSIAFTTDESFERWLVRTKASAQLPLL